MKGKNESIKGAFPLIIAHRGGGILAGENSIEALRRAKEAGSDYSEIDIRKASDGFVVSNPPFIIQGGREENKGKVLLNSLSVKEAEKEGVYSLREMLREAERNGVKLMIEIKEKGTAVEVYDIVEEEGVKAVFISFFHDEMLRLKRERNARTGILLVGEPCDIEEMMKSARADYLLANHKYITNETITGLKGKGIKTIVWNINDYYEARSLALTGVHGISTDRPSMLAKLRAEMVEGDDKK